MIKNFIIGAGFTAAITKILIGKNSTIIGSVNHKLLKNEKFIRRKYLECNKMFAKKASSYGTLKFKLNNGIFHDRLVLGGNSTVWGGKINLKNFPLSVKNILIKKNINFKKLSFETTGTIANNKDIYQIQSDKNKIIQTQDLRINVKNAHIIKFFAKNKKIFIIIKDSFHKNYKKIEVKKLFLCIGSIQLIDLLYRSNYLKKNDIIEFSEFGHEFKLNFISAPFKKNVTTVRYHFSRALGHYFGIQYFSWFLKLFRFLPLCVDQNFFPKKNIYRLKVKNNEIIEEDNKKSIKKFGVSIHYCNMKINKIEINKFLRKINKNIYGLGMSCINQSRPGPISNEIIVDAYKKTGKK